MEMHLREVRPQLDIPAGRPAAVLSWLQASRLAESVYQGARNRLQDGLMGYENSKWALAQLRFLVGEGAGAAKVLIMAMSESANNKDPQWFGQEYELFESCGLADRSARRGIELLKVAGLISREQKGNQYAATIYHLHPDTTLSEPARVAVTNKSEPARIASETANSASETARMDMEYREEQSSNSLIPSSSSTPESETANSGLEIPEWFEILAKDKRWPEFSETEREQFVKAIESASKHEDLTAEAILAIEWLGTKEGQKKKRLKAFWLNWVKRPPFASSTNGSKPDRRLPTNDEYVKAAALDAERVRSVSG